jgi:hypothetical protein
MRDSTDASSRNYRTEDSIRVHPDDGNIDTIGARPCQGNCDRILDLDSREGDFNSKVFNSSLGRFINLVSKPHDFMNSWNYNDYGYSIGREYIGNTMFDFSSYAAMPVAGFYTGFAFSATAYQPMIYLK